MRKRKTGLFRNKTPELGRILLKHKNLKVFFDIGYTCQAPAKATLVKNPVGCDLNR
jgi:hypothetical protein